MIIGKMYHPLEGFLITQVETGLKSLCKVDQDGMGELYKVWLKMHNFPFPNGIIETYDQVFNLFNGM
jgi:hypothetical protein